LQLSAIVVTSDNETSTKEEESSELESSDGERSDVWFKTDKKLSIEPFLGTTGQHRVIDSPESDVEFMSSFIGDDFIRLLTEWKVLPKTQAVQYHT
jgi:hypothetical protein